MINPRELSIGNLVQGEPLSHPRLGISSDGTTEITGLGIHYIEQGVMKVDPLEITPDRLKMIGFQHLIGEDVIWDKLKLSYFDELWWIPGCYFITHEGNDWVLYQSTDEDTYWQLSRPDSIHNIQNTLYHLEGVDLKIQ